MNAIASTNTQNVAILGASGYTGAELVRLLAHHPHVRIAAMTAEKRAGAAMGEVFPHLGALDLPKLVKIADVDFAGVQAVFCALPHGLTQEVIAALPRHLNVIDLSADFRLHDVATYAKWYGHEHLAPDLQKEAVYGLTELARDAVKKARLIANPGCYPTSAQLPLVPLIEAGMIETTDIIIDAKSGVTGAGREAKEANLFAEVTEGIHAYGIASHRHAPEIEQGLSQVAGRDILINFTAHLMPMSRGILSSIYVKLANDAGPDDLRAALTKKYAHEPFVHILSAGSAPATRHVRGTNHCRIGVFPDRIKGRAIVISVIDNLVKGASGQAIQNFNVQAGLPETTALQQEALFPVSVTYDPTSLPENLPRPLDDGACAHLIGMRMPALVLSATDGTGVDLSVPAAGRTVIYAYPKTGLPNVLMPAGWDDIPGARGCTPESCAFRDHHEELRRLGARVFGLSVQDTDYQRELAERLHLPFAILSDANLALTKALRLPTFTIDGMTLIKRLTLVLRDGVIEHVFYPIFPPNAHADEVCRWLANNRMS